jgi:uncharacterized protein (TIGR00251 family)
MSDPDGPLHAHRDGVVLTLRVQPRAARSELLDIREGAIRVRLAAPPVDGAANAALLELLSKALKLRKSELAIISGATSRNKRVLAKGLTVQDVAERLGLVTTGRGRA